ncbi:hypothetical protein FE810_05365 [Thalassotalea litorea]|uniref:Uncharacterized protein n=1 Tax=Thalassotalea litorea TaxID=2020715 RepID=A0A5R9IKU7_9GAMM|nr:hypothetical protein [Thalassotalea litorea]TLU66150.1 hypothetical protein FE810_05365 [Thalassotalea litorea]
MSTIDYSKYTLNDLLDVKEKISPDSPNYNSLQLELENRKDEISEAIEKSKEEAFSIAKNRVKIIGYFQLTAAVAILLYYVGSIFDGSFSFLSTVVAIPFIALNAIAGMTAIKENHKYYWLSILNQSLQVLSIGLGSISATYSGLGSAYVYISWNTQFLFGASASFSPGFSFNQYTGNLPTQWISIDIVAIIFISALLTVSKVKSTANKSLNQDQ